MDGSTVHVFATPISRTIFEKYYFVLAKTFNSIWSGGLSITAGPRVAALLLRDTAKQMNQWDGQEGVEQGLVADIHRLTKVLVNEQNKGWVPVPLQEAIARGILDEDDASEVENALAFFTVASHMHRKVERKELLQSAMGIWGAQVTLSGYTEYSNSLLTSTMPVNTGANAPEPASPASSIPY